MSTPDTYDEDADFATGFDSTEPEPTATSADALDDDPTATPAPDAPASGDSGPAASEQQGGEAAAEDPFAALPQAVRDLLATVPRLQTELESLRRTAGMVPALQSKLDKLERGAAPPPQEATPPKRFEKVESLRAQGLDEIADAMEEIAAAMPGDKAAQPKAETPAPAAPAATPPAAAEDPVLRALDQVRPSWSQDLLSTDFGLWLTQQPAEIQREVTGTQDAGVILKHLASFDKHKQARPTAPTPSPVQTVRHQRMSAAITPRGDGRPVRKPGDLDDEDADMNAGFYGR